MAVFNNGNITATVTPPQGYTGPYKYELFKYDDNINQFITVNGNTEGFASSFVNPITKTETSHTFGNPGGFEDNIDGTATWVGLAPAQYKVVVETTTGLVCNVNGTVTVGADDPTDPCYGFDISATVDSDTAITVTVLGGTSPFTWTLNGTVTIPTTNGGGTFTFNGLIPSTFYTIGIVDDNACSPSNVSVTTTGDADPVFTCTLANFQVADGVEGETILIGVDATVDAGTLNSVTPDVYINGNTMYTANITIPAGYQNTGGQLTTCANTATGTATLTEFECSDTTITIAAGIEGDDILTSAITANGISNITAVYQTGTQIQAVYAVGTTTLVDVVFEVPNGYSNSGDLITCEATAPAGNSSTLCDDFVEGSNAVEISSTSDVTSQGAADGSITVLIDFVGAAPFELTLNPGPGETVKTLANAGQIVFEDLTADDYTINVEDDNGCLVILTATIADPDPCAGFQGIAVTSSTNPTAGASDGSITVEVVGGSGNYTWTLNGNAETPTDNGDETFTFSGLSAAEGAGTQYLIVLTDEDCGSSNTEETLIDPGSGGGTDERTWYYLHGVDDDWLRMTGGGLLDASSYGLFNNGVYSGTAVGTLTEALTHYFANSASLSNGMDIEQFEMNESITSNGEVTQIVFNALINGEAGQYYYLLVPDNNLFPENLTTAGVTIFPWPGLAGNAADRQAIQISGVNYYIYQLQGSTSASARTCSFS